MMKTHCFIIWLIVLGGMIACHSCGTTDLSSPLRTDSVSFETGKDSSYSCRITVDYPLSGDSFSLAVADYINKELKANVDWFAETDEIAFNGGFSDGGRVMIGYYGGIVGKFFANSMDDALETGYSLNGWTFDIAIRKTDDTPRYVTYETTAYSYTGGAHGGTTEKAVNLVKPFGKVLKQTVDSLKLNEIQPLLRQGVLSYLKEQGNIEITDETLNEMLFIEDGIIPLPTCQPYLTPNGLCFVYQQYEIACYAMGIVSFVVPYSEIKPFMTPEALQLIE